MTQDQLDAINAVYQQNPHVFDEDTVDYIQQANTQYNIPFQRNEEASEFNLVNTVGNLINGFVEGFTTLDPGLVEEKNTYDSIAGSIGHLLGFMGIIPGLGTAGSLVAKGVANTARLFKGASAIGKVTKVLKVAEGMATFKSIPMMGADKVLKMTGLVKAGKAAKNFVGMNAMSKLGVSKQMAVRLGYGAEKMVESGLHLGTASAISSWTKGTDAMMESFQHGLMGGAAFGALGEALPSGVATNFGKDGFMGAMKNLVKNPNTGDLEWKGVARVLSSSIFMGLPATLDEQPTELQIYNYLLGAYFGAGEMSGEQKMAMEFIQEAPGKMYKKDNIEVPRKLAEMAMSQPEKLPGWAILPAGAKAEVLNQITLEGLRTFEVANGKNSDYYDVSEAGIRISKNIEEVYRQHMDEIEAQRSTGEITNNEAMQLKDHRFTQFYDAVKFTKMQESYDKLLKDNAEKLNDPLVDAEALTLELRTKAIEVSREHIAKEARDVIQNEIESRKLDVQYVDNMKKFAEFEKTELSVRLSEIDTYAEDKQLNPIHRKSTFNIAFESLGSEQFKDLPTETQIDKIVSREKEIIDIFKDHENESFPKLMETLKAKYKGLDLVESSENWNVFKNAFEKASQLKVIPQGIIDFRGDGMTIRPYKYDADGNSVQQWKTEPYLVKAMKEHYGEDFEFYNIKNIWTNQGQRKLYDSPGGFSDKESGKWVKDREFNEADFLKLTEQLAGEGFVVFGGSKDSGNLLVYKAPIQEFAQAESIMGEAKSAVSKIQKMNPNSKLRTQYSEYMKEVFGKVNPDKNDPKVQAKILQWANNMNVIQKLNKFDSIEETMQALDAGHILANPKALNKRISLLNNGFFIMKPEYFPADAKEGLNTVIVNAINKNGMTMAEGPADLMRWVKNKSGNFEKIKVDTHVDGVIYVRDDIYDGMTKQLGLDINTGSQKGTLTHAAQGEGMLLGKFAYHRAGEKMSKAMTDKNVHTVLNTTSAKQIGKRKVYDSHFTKEGSWDFYESGTANQVDMSVAENMYKIPHESFTLTEGGEHHSQLQDTSYKTQLASGMDSKRFPEGITWWNNMIRQKMIGDADEMNRYNMYKDGKLNSKDLDPQKLSLQAKIDVLYAGKNDAVYRKLMNHYINALRDNMVSEHELGIDSADRLRKEIEGTVSGAEKIMKLWGGKNNMNLTPAIMNHRLLRAYFEKVVENAIRNEVVRPKAEGSFSTIFQPYRPDLMQGIHLQEGEVILGEKLRNYKIPWLDGKIEIEKAIELHKNETDTAKKATMEDYLSIALQRVPTDSPSGVRILKIVGFSELAGSGSILHPKDMANAGGADLDIDKGFIYTNMPTAVKREFQAVKNDWYEYHQKDSNGKWKKLSGKEIERLKATKKFDKGLKDDTIAEVEIDAKGENSPFYVNLPAKEEAMMNNPFSMADSKIMYKVNRFATEGNALLGPGINITKILQGMLEDPNSKFVPRPDAMEQFQALKRTLINSAADAADGKKMVTSDQVMEVFGKRLYGITDPEIMKDFVKSVKEHPLKKVNSLLNQGKLNGKDLTLPEIVSELGKQRTELGGEIKNPFFNAGLMMSELEFGHHEVYPWLSNEYGKNLTILSQKYGRASKEIKTVLGRIDLGQFNDWLKTPEYQKLLAENPTEAYRKAREILSQDIMNLVSIEAAQKYMPKDITTNQINELRDNIWELKERYIEQVLIPKGSKKKADMEAVRQAKSEIEKELSSIRSQSMMSEDFQKLFDTMLLSTFRPQKENWDSFLKNNKWRLDEQGLTEKQIKDQWMATNIDSWAFDFPFVSNEVKIFTGHRYNELSQAVSKEELSRTELEINKDYAQNDVIQGEDTIPDYEFLQNVTVDQAKIIARDAEKDRPATRYDKELDLADKTMKDYFYRYPEQIRDFQALFLGEQLRRNGLNDVDLVGSTMPRISSAREYIEFTDMLRGIMTGKNKPVPLKWWHYFVPVKTFAAKMYAQDPIKINKEINVITRPGKMVLGEAKVFSSTLGVIQNRSNSTQIQIEGWTNAIQDDYESSDVKIMIDQMNINYAGVGDKLIEIAIDRRENQRGKSNGESDIYANNWIKSKRLLDRMEGKGDKFYVPKLQKSLTAKEMVDYMDREMTNWSKKVAKKYIFSQAGQDLLKKPGIMTGGYLNLDKMTKHMDGQMSHFKPEFLGMQFMERVYHQENIENIQIGILETVGRLVDKQFESVAELKESGMYKAWKRGETIPATMDSLFRLAEADNLSPVVGQIENFNVRREILDMLKETKINKDNWMEYKDLKLQDHQYANYFPHMNYDKTIVKNWIEKNLGEIDLSGKSLDNKTQAKINGMSELINGNENSSDILQDWESRLERPITKLEHVENIKPRAWNMAARSKDNPTPGWEKSLGVLKSYENKMSRSYWTAINSFLNRRSINQFKQGTWNLETKSFDKPMGEHNEAWSAFMTQFNMINTGRPSLFPDKWINSEDGSHKQYKVKNNLYYAFTDQAYKKQVENISRKFFGNKNFFKQLPKVDSDEYKALDPNVRQQLSQLYDIDVSRKLYWVSQVDAKWNLMSLLTHTRTMVNNIVGGTVTTVSSTGFEHWKKATDEKWLRENVFVDFNGWNDITSFVESHGGVESMFKNEMMLSGKFKAGKPKEFMSDIVKMMKQRKAYSEDTVRSVAKKHFGDMADSVLEGAGWFMRKSEVHLRTRSWMAHYLKAREVFSANGLTLEKDHPWLIELANKGVAATQFLYNNANRPMFASTNVGKIYSRFQLWAWNSLKLRKEWYKAGRDAGFAPGTTEFERFRRIMTADMFMFTLASVLPGTLFESTMAPPFSYLQDLADFFYGDSEERERAFYGSLPHPFNILQTVSPPSSRVLFNAISFINSGDWEKLQGQAVSWLPFGRLGKSVLKTVQNPSMVVEELTGIPTHRINSLIKKGSKKDDKKEEKQIKYPFRY